MSAEGNDGRASVLRGCREDGGAGFASSRERILREGEGEGEGEVAWRPVTLRFLDREAEGEFRRHYSARFLRQHRRSLLLGLFLYSLFGALDPWIIPEAVRFTWFVRFGVVAPLILLAFAASFSRRFEALAGPVWVVLGMAAGTGLMAMMWARPSPDDSFYFFSGLMLVNFFVLCFTRIRFVPASVTAWTLTVLHGVLSALKGASLPAQVCGAFFLSGANVIGMFACHAMEESVRVDFLQQRRIRRQAEELRKALSEVKVLTGLIPVCAWCRKVCDDGGYWKRIEEYVASRSEAVFTHGICPECAGKVHPTNPG